MLHYFCHARKTAAVASASWLSFESELLVELKGKPVEASTEDRTCHVVVMAQELNKASSGRIELTGNAAIVVDPFVANFASFFFWILLGELVPSLHRRGPPPCRRPGRTLPPLQSSPYFPAAAPTATALAVLHAAAAAHDMMDMVLESTSAVLEGGSQQRSDFLQYHARDERGNRMAVI